MTAATKMVLLVYRVKDAAALAGGKSDPSRTAAALRQLVKDTLSRLVSGDLGQELRNLQQSSGADTPSSAVPIPSTLTEAWTRGIQEVPGPGYVTRSENLKFLLSPEGLPLLASAAKRHLSRVKVMVAYLEPGSRRSPGLVWAGAVLATIAAALVIILMVRRHSGRRTGA